MSLKLKALIETILLLLGANFIINSAFFGLDEYIGNDNESFVFLTIAFICFLLLYRIVYENKVLRHINKE